MSNSMLYRCECHEDDYPSFVAELHGLSQALTAKGFYKLFWFSLLLICCACGTLSTILVVIENMQGSTATSTTIKLVTSLEMPAITVCPKYSDAFHFKRIFHDVKARLPNITTQEATDLFRLWLGGSGLENFASVLKFNKTYVDKLGGWYRVWSEGYDHKEFFDRMQAEHGYSCEDFFYSCELGGRIKDCCKDIFAEQSVMRRGLCYQTIRHVNQTENDYVGRLVVKIHGLPSITTPSYNYSQSQITVYINDNFDNVIDFPRYYLYRDAWNELRFTARFVELLEHPGDCTTTILNRFVEPYDCVVPYLNNIEGLDDYHVCDPAVIVNDYYKTVMVRSDFLNSSSCLPGCQRFEYDVTLQQTWALEPFTKYRFNLEASFYDLQYEHVKEVQRSSVVGFMGQIGGQFGFFLGFSIITLVQFIVYLINGVGKFIYRIFHPKYQQPIKVVKCDCPQNKYQAWTAEVHGLSQVLLSRGLKQKIFWSIVLIFCGSCGILTTTLLFIDYFRGHTLTSTTIRLVPSLSMPSITFCRKNPDMFYFEGMLDDIKADLPDITDKIAVDLISFWLGGIGLGNVKPIDRFTSTYIDQLNGWYLKWSEGYDHKEFFDLIQSKYAIPCNDFFHSCELAGQSKDCCEEIFAEQWVMRKGLCYQTRKNINQTKLADVGKLSVKIKSFSSNISLQYSDPEPQLHVYINDNHNDFVDFPTFTLFKDEWSGAYLTARLIDLLERNGDCTTTRIGKDTSCFVRKWLTSNLVVPYNCTFPYLNVSGMQELSICDPSIIVKNYQNTVEVVHPGTLQIQDCLPGCKSWEYDLSLQQTLALEPFIDYKFILEVSFSNLQYEHIKEVLAASIPSLMSQLGGQFGFFMGLSIITMLQLVIHAVSKIVSFFYCIAEPKHNDLALTTISNGHANKEDNEINHMYEMDQINDICEDITVTNRKSHSV